MYSFLKRYFILNRARHMPYQTCANVQISKSPLVSHDVLCRTARTLSLLDNSQQFLQCVYPGAGSDDLMQQSPQRLVRFGAANNQENQPNQERADLRSRVLPVFRNPHRQFAFVPYNMLVIGDSQARLFCGEIEKSNLMINGVALKAYEKVIPGGCNKEILDKLWELLNRRTKFHESIVAKNTVVVMTTGTCELYSQSNRAMLSSKQCIAKAHAFISDLAKIIRLFSNSVEPHIYYLNVFPPSGAAYSRDGDYLINLYNGLISKGLNQLSSKTRDHFHLVETEDTLSCHTCHIAKKNLMDSIHLTGEAVKAIMRILFDSFSRSVNQRFVYTDRW